jgi:hypothetical protein
VFSATFPTTALQTKVYRNQPLSVSFPSYQESTIVTRSLLRNVICLIALVGRGAKSNPKLDKADMEVALGINMGVLYHVIIYGGTT